MYVSSVVAVRVWEEHCTYSTIAEPAAISLEHLWVTLADISWWGGMSLPATGFKIYLDLAVRISFQPSATTIE